MSPALPQAVLRELLGEERTSDMLSLLSVLVIVLHLWLAIGFLRPINLPVTPATPLMMEVSMVSLQAPKPTITPNALVARPLEKIEVVKSKPVVKKSPMVVQKPADFTHQENASQQAEPAETTAVNSAPTSQTNRNSTSEQQVTEANYRANYLHNPAPEYPLLARNREWTGKVLLRVSVSAAGSCESIELAQSSGHDVLDEAAQQAVKQWKFIPAKRGETVIASIVMVPIVFNLTENVKEKNSHSYCPRVA